MNTPRTTRRLRRSFAAISAVLLGAAALAAVVSSPASAANTASEALIDTNNDNVVDAREFGGRDRYDTALRLAQNFGKSRGLGGIADVFVASGETLVDAVAVSGLAGYLDAPVVLTQKDSLPGAVANYLEDYGARNIHVLGGTAAVSDDVVEALEALDHSPTVARIQGADRYATAAQIAATLSGGNAAGNVWCGGNAKAAILTNGGDVSLAYAMAVGPIASRLQLPVLLTAHGELPAATRGAITGERYEHIVIVGGTASVSADVAGDLTAAGVDTVTRIGGDSPAAASVELAKLAANGCSGDLGGVSTTTVALVSERGLPDGVAASPVLASSYRSEQLVPMLVVGDSLPAAVRNYLAATPQQDAAGNKLHLEIVAIGGPAAVTPGAMSAALAAAGSAPALTVKIVSPTDWDNDGQMDDQPRAGETSFQLRFSDGIAGDTDATADATTRLRARLLDVLRIGGVPAVLNAQDASAPGVAFGGNTSDCKPDVVTVNLAVPLTAREQISIADTTLEFGAQSDRRPLARSSTSVVAKESRKPTFEIVSIIGQSTITVIAKDNLNTDTGLAGGETLTGGGATDEVTVNTSATRDADGNNVDELTISSVSGEVPAASDARVTEQIFTVNLGRALERGDTIKIAKDAIADAAGNGNREWTSLAPITPTSLPTVSVVVSSHVHDVQAKYVVPTELTAGNEDDAGAEDVFFTAKPNGRAAGANGNGWTFDFRTASTYSADKRVSIEVLVNQTGKRAFITFVGGKPKFSDLAAALRAHSGFNSLWDVSVDNVDGECASADKALTVTEVVTAAGDDATSDHKVRDGSSKMAIEARFSGYVASVTSSTLLDDVFAAAAARDSAATPAAVGLPGTVGATVTGPIRTVRYVASTEDLDLLPRSGDRYDVEAATIADGYADNVDTTDADESKNKEQLKQTIDTGGTAPR